MVMLPLYIKYPEWIDPFVIEGLPIRWYAVMYLVAFFIAYVMFRYQAKHDGMIEINEDDTVLIIGAGPTGVCTLLCARLKHPRRLIVCEKSPERRRFISEHYPDVLVTTPEECRATVLRESAHGGADAVLEVAGTEDSFRLAWECARPNAVVTIVALYDRPQVLPLPDMYGKNLTFKTGGVDGCDCAEILRLIANGQIDTTPLITHRFPLDQIEEAYHIFENHLEDAIKIAITPPYSHRT